MVPTRAATLGVKGHRPAVGTRAGQELLDVFGVIHLVSAAVHRTTLECPRGAKKRTGKSKTRRLQESLAAHWRIEGRPRRMATK